VAFVKKYPSPSEHLKHGHTLSTHTFNMFAKPLEVIFHVFSARLGLGGVATLAV